MLMQNRHCLVLRLGRLGGVPVMFEGVCVEIGVLSGVLSIINPQKRTKQAVCDGLEFCFAR